MNEDVSFCQSYSDMLKSCKKNNNLAWLVNDWSIFKIQAIFLSNISWTFIFKSL
jgi:hypothetical protein